MGRHYSEPKFKETAEAEIYADMYLSVATIVQPHGRHGWEEQQVLSIIRVRLLEMVADLRNCDCCEFLLWQIEVTSIKCQWQPFRRKVADDKLQQAISDTTC